MSQAKKRKTASPTILDYLNDDCWRYVLDYVDLEQVIISELVCRQWQAVVLRYIQSVRVALNDHGWSSPTVTPWPKVRWLELEEDEWPSFELWSKKLGSTVVFAFCSSESHLEIIRKNCPNVESLTIARFRKPIRVNIKNKRFKRLQHIYFECCYYVTDRCVSQFINKSTTDLEIRGDTEEYAIKGQFFNSVKSKLQSLTFIQMDLKLNHLLSAGDWLSELKKLHLSDLPSRIYENIHLVLEKTPKLEHLHLSVYSRGLAMCQDVCRLANLTHLSGDVVSSDEDLEVVARGCKELRYLQMDTNTVSLRGLQAMCRHAGARLVHLDLGSNHRLTDDDMAACFRGCTSLTKLDVRLCYKLTERLRTVAEEARREMDPSPPPLRISRGVAWNWIIE